MHANRKISAFVAQHTTGMRALLEKMVRIQSGSYNKSGVDQVLQTVAESLLAEGLRLNRVPRETYGDVLIAETPAAADQGNLLLIGHMDTVFPADTDFIGYREDGDKAYGPGVADMKGGLVVGIYALKALAAIGVLEEIPLRFVFNADEEIGSPGSHPIIVAEARRSAAAFVLECGSLAGGVVTGRKGRLRVGLSVTGRAGHAAFAGAEKASAVLALAHQIIALEALNGRSAGLTVNVGKIKGGIGPNTVAERARAAVDIRFVTQGELDFVQTELDRIRSTAPVPGTTVDFAERAPLAPMEAVAQNRALFNLVAEQARNLRISVVEEFRKGCSDANTVAHQGTPVVDGLGPLGDQDHSTREFILLSSLAERCTLLAHTLSECHRRLAAGERFGCGA